MADTALKYITLTPENCDFYGMRADYTRMPDEIASQVSAGVRNLAKQPVGGHIRFATDARVLYLRAQVKSCSIVGFDLYRLDEEKGQEFFVTGFRSERYITVGNFEARPAWLGGKMETYTLNFPYGAVIEKVEVGINEEATFTHGAKYRNDKPVLYYGSSITTGGSATRPGSTYISMISQRYNMGYVNFGFSGNCKAEPVMADYLAAQEMSMFVYDYDHNAPNIEYLEATHLPFYQKIRAANPDLPIVMISRPDYVYNVKDSEARIAVIRKTYDYAKARGENVYFIPGSTLMRGDYARNCTKDGCHPNDIGFYRMAKVIGPQLAAIFGWESPAFDVL